MYSILNDNMRGIITRALAVLVALSICSLLRAQSAAPDKEHVLYTFWTAQSQYAGYIIADEEGLFDKEGLDLILRHYDGTPATDMLSSGRADFISLTLVDALEARLKGLDLVNIYQFMHESSFVIVSRNPIKNLQELRGKEILTYRAFNNVLID